MVKCFIENDEILVSLIQKNVTFCFKQCYCCNHLWTILYFVFLQRNHSVYESYEHGKDRFKMLLHLSILLNMSTILHLATKFREIRSQIDLEASYIY